MTKQQFTVGKIDIPDRIDQAAYTMRRMPKVKVKGYSSYWPEVLRETSEAYGYNQVALRMGTPNSKQISEMDEVMEWLTWLEKDEMRVVWLRANSVRWKVIERVMAMGRTKLNKTWLCAMVKLQESVKSIHAGGKTPMKPGLKSLKMCAQNSCEQISVNML